MWQQILRNKYLKKFTLSKVSYKPEDSNFWAGLMKVKEVFLCLGSFVLKDGSQIRFWEHMVGYRPLMVRYPSLYHIVRSKSATVAKVLESVPLIVSFCRALVGQNLNLWLDLVARLVQLRLGTDRDAFRWDLTPSNMFSVQSMYRTLINNAHVFYHSILWKLKVPLKIKIFLWYLIKCVTLTKDNLAKRNWQGCKRCAFCSHDESI